MYACMHVCIGNGKIRDKQGTKSRQKIDPEGLSQFPWGSHNGGAQWGKTGKNTTVYNGRETTRK
jgi:hypothetical protein